ncbi:hypothetical protein [Fusibacter ferrireducens]|uniref:Uncharacterized protein n=1 Tax=Fusibacter ferrireducens TaxID=2785058 RepID=A0ABR9ZZB3_9FIRM|nr:hypothetical protein [Fusibacter ferrireducens]MBF4695797.1 hypothetical protein [Fusibacter ferrireducens]
MTRTMNVQKATGPMTLPLEFNLLNASALYFDELNQIKKSYDKPSVALNAKNENLSDALETVSKAYHLKGNFSEKITFEPSNGTEKVNQIINILCNFDVEVQGIRLNQDQSIIEMGFSNSTAKYKALLILESIGL